MKRKFQLLGASLISGLLLSTAVSATTVNLFASKDTSIWENGQVDGTGQGAFVGKSGTGIIRRSLIAFDVGAIAAGSTINSATLTIHVNQEAPFGSTETISLNVLNEDWNEATVGGGGSNFGGGGGIAPNLGDATWTDSGNGAWTAGGNFDATVSASASVGGLGFHTWTGTGLVEDLQDWLDNGDNFGWIIRGNEVDNSSAKRFSSRENVGDNGSRLPVLTVDYTVTVVPVPAAVWLFGSGLFGLIGVARCKNRS